MADLTSDAEAARRARIALRVYEAAFDESDTFEGALGTWLAYTMGAILHGSFVDVDDATLYAQLRAIYPWDHVVWTYMMVSPELRDDTTPPAG